MITNAELIFWCVCGAIAILGVLAMPMIDNYFKYKENRRMFEER